MLDVDDDGEDDVDELVVAPGLVVPGDAPVVDEIAPVAVVTGADVEELSSSVVELEAGATATGVCPTWESARPTICHVRTVATTKAATQAAAMRHEII